ncbi:MAG: FAD:protein FMN transferase [Bacteroidia bacterium]|nr:FAD:protein FMN transferase [Bacteroidia bacterium]
MSLLIPVSCSRRTGYVSVSGFAQGGTYTVKFNMEGVSVGKEAIGSSIDSILTLVDTTLSGYNKSSILSRFNAGEYVTLNDLFCDIYSFCYDVFDETGGCVDVGSGPLFDIWGFGFSTDSLPSDDLVKETLENCGIARLPRELVPGMTIAGSELTSGNRATLGIVRGGTLQGGAERSEALPGGKTPDGNRATLGAVTLNFNAVAQGYTCDLVADYLRSIGVKDMLVDIGEIYCEGLNPSGKGWTIAVDRPVDGNQILGADIDGVWISEGKACGIVTSGNYRKFYIRDGHKYAHTIDPRTGYPVEHNLLSATIVTSSGAAADAYATYCMVIGLEEAEAFIESRNDIEGYLIFDTDDGMKEWASSGFTLAETGAR